MSVYLVLCLLLAYPARLCVLARRQGRSAQRVALAMSCVVLWFFMAMRAQTVGVDTKYYVCIYQQFPQISWKELFTAQLYPTPRRTWELDLEPGYRLLNKLLSIYLPAPQWITVANSALIIALLYRKGIQTGHKSIQQDHLRAHGEHFLQDLVAVLFHNGHVHALLLQRFAAGGSERGTSIRHQKSNFVHGYFLQCVQFP